MNIRIRRIALNNNRLAIITSVGARHAVPDVGIAILHQIETPTFNSTRSKWSGIANQHSWARSPVSFILFTPFTTSPNRHSRSHVQMVTKYAPAKE
jgi:hypothetical protein